MMTVGDTQKLREGWRRVKEGFSKQRRCVECGRGFVKMRAVEGARSCRLDLVARANHMLELK